VKNSAKKISVESLTDLRQESPEVSRFLTYALVTPARNEEAFIESTIQSVIAQNVKPIRWVIVSDGSTDRTDEIVRKYSALHDWIVLLRMPERQERHFGGKVLAFNAGLERVKDLNYDAIVCMDADISFEPDYFEFLLSKLKENSELGIVGTPFSEDGKIYDFRFSSLDHVSGACQVFRRECFEAIGGYVPSKGGGIDVMAVLSARMKGWNTRTFPEKRSTHHRPMGSANDSSRLSAQFRLGQRQYRLGFHPLWQTLRAVYQMKGKPYVFGGVSLLMGYFHAMFTGMESPMSPELIRFQRRDQMRRLRRLVGLAPKASNNGNKSGPRASS
jgi:glycosyltransferase involved in cell wall biosynthesis